MFHLTPWHKPLDAMSIIGCDSPDAIPFWCTSQHNLPFVISYYTQNQNNNIIHSHMWSNVCRLDYAFSECMFNIFLLVIPDNEALEMW